ncbi:Carotenoid cleavage dioxygenase [Parasponia andersonii]|uniref:Carotenoid cleavage dioxygenase n=1 Tax=Parasponia andersonii TaxID=3476 RepID=A0A2P5CJH9_PARAD|nr:Carotenoid cleavage dioxygenase [Parasponia andersonii]
MQTQTYLQIIPPKLPSPTVHRVIPSPPTKTPPTSVSISTSSVVNNRVTIGNHNKILTASPNDVVEDSTAAFWDYQFLFVSQRSETVEPVALRVVDGAVPEDFPAGTYYLTGPGIFSDDHGSTVHPLDGHGYLRAFVFGSEGTEEVKFMARYVETEAQKEEHDPETDTWRFAYRGPFSVLKGGQRVGNTKVMKNVANTSVLMWGGRLLCLWEGGDPYEIESRSLDTIGKLDLIDGCDSMLDVGINVRDPWGFAVRLLRPVLYGVFKMPPKRMLSHYKLDAQKNRLLTVSCNAEDMLLPRSNFTFYEFDSNFRLLHKQEFNIPDHLMVHDWAFTDSYYIIFANRIKLDVLGAIRAVTGISPMITALSVNPSKNMTTPIYLLPRFPNKENELIIKRDWRVPLEAPSVQLWLLHVGNAYQNLEDNGSKINIQIQACACSYHWFNFHKLFGYDWHNGKLDPSIMNVNQGQNTLPHLLQVSITLDTANGNYAEKCEVEPLNKWNKSADFPVINPVFSGTKNTYVYAAASSGSRLALPHFPFDTVAKLNVLNKSVHTWSVSSRRFIGEPTFVPRGTEEDDGYVLVVEYAVSVQKCYLVILNAKKIGETDALVAKLEVPRHLNFPLGFHGFWAASK